MVFFQLRFLTMRSLIIAKFSEHIPLGPYCPLPFPHPPHSVPKPRVDKQGRRGRQGRNKAANASAEMGFHTKKRIF